MVRSVKAVDLWVCNKNHSTIHFYYLQPYKLSFQNILTRKVNIFYTTSKLEIKIASYCKMCFILLFYCSCSIVLHPFGKLKQIVYILMSLANCMLYIVTLHFILYSHNPYHISAYCNSFTIPLAILSYGEKISKTHCDVPKKNKLF